MWIASIVPITMFFALFAEEHVFDPFAIQVISWICWKGSCPLSLLEEALTYNQPINKGWITQPLLTCFLVPIVSEIVYLMVIKC